MKLYSKHKRKRISKNVKKGTKTNAYIILEKKFLVSINNSNAN